MTAGILVVDDDIEHLSFVSHLLKRAGYSVQSASSGSECLELMAKAPPDLIITDLFMPTIDGIELALHIEEQEFDIPILGMTGIADSTMYRQHRYAFELAAQSGILQKPFGKEELLEKVENAVGKPKPAEDAPE